jgi:hypothetical protein
MELTKRQYQELIISLVKVAPEYPDPSELQNMPTEEAVSAITTWPVIYAEKVCKYLESRGHISLYKG